MEVGIEGHIYIYSISYINWAVFIINKNLNLYISVFKDIEVEYLSALL